MAGTNTDRRYRTSRLKALAFDFGIDVDDGAVGAFLDDVLGALAVPGEPEHLYRLTESPAGQWPTRWVVELDGQRLRSLPNRSAALGYLLWHMNREVVNQSGDFVLVHAAAATVGGAAVVLPAPSASGKTTMVAGLVQAGMDYLSDEIAAVDPSTGLVHPYAKPLSIDRASFGVFSPLAVKVPEDIRPWLSQKWPIRNDVLRPGSLGEPSPAAFVIAPRYDPVGPTALEPMGRAETVTLLIQSCFNFDRHGQRGVEALAEIARSSQCYRLAVGDLSEACALVGELVGMPAAASQPPR